MRRIVLLALLAGIPAAAAAQSSEFGVRGLGLPGREQSARAMGSAGAFSFFDPGSSVTPASLAYIGSLTATFTALGDYRSSTDPAGTASVRDPRFPQFALGGPIPRKPVWVGLSYSNYTTRDYSLVLPATVTLRGVPVGVNDTIESRGGINDFQLGVAWRPTPRLAIGLGAHIFTGLNKLDVHRVFSDSAYLPSRQRSELSFAGFGMSLGVLGQLTRTLTLGLLARSDGHVSVQQDSLSQQQRVDLPVTLGAALQWWPTAKLRLGGQVLHHNWSSANNDIIANGGVGAVNTVEAAAGLELIHNLRRPERRPIRLGFRYAQLPFPLAPGATAREYGVSLGTGYSFAADRAVVDFSVERAWRRQDSQFSEHAWIVTAGVTVRP
ncbi:MAG: hypothetical protein ACM3NS_03335 [Deltaproteobacteria bacterium]